jgi:hypothetical protein
MPNPVVHFEIRAKDADATRAFYGKLLGWAFHPAEEPGYTYVNTGVESSVTGGIGPASNSAGFVTFFVGVNDVEATLQMAEQLGGKIVVPAVHLPTVTYGLFADPEGNIIGISKRK